MARRWLVVVLALAVAGCGGKSDLTGGADAGSVWGPPIDAGSGGDVHLPSDAGLPGNVTKGAKLNVALSVVGSKAAKSKISAQPRELSDVSAWPGFKNVAAFGGGLSSLKLFVTNVMICKSLNMNGTAVNGGTGCVNVYNAFDPALQSTKPEDHASVISAALAKTEGFVDVVDPASRAVLAKTLTLTENDVGEYHYGLVSWAPPVKLTGTLVDPVDGTTPVLFTKAATGGTCMVNANTYPCSRASSSLQVGPAEETILLSNADIAFKFQKPLAITAADVANETAYAVTFAFNLDGLLQGVTAPGATNFPPLGDGTYLNKDLNGNVMSDVGNTLALVGAQIAPVFAPVGTKVLRESYTGTLPSSWQNGSYQLRIELYSVEGDPERTVYGVSTATLPTADTRGYLTGFHRIYGLETNADGSLELLDYEGKAKVSKLARIAVVGGKTSAELACGSVDMACTPGEVLPVALTLDALEPIP